MTEREDAAEKKLPVTAELGGEGGSYGDGTVQAETMKGVLGNPRVDPKLASPATDADGAAAASEGEQVRESPDIVKHATEPPER